MTKAKVVLAGVAMMAAIGGAFAFKASRIPQVLYKLDTTNPIPANRLCTQTTLVPWQTTPVQGQAGLTTLPYYHISASTTFCPTTRLYTAQ